MDFIQVGKITNTHGIKWEIKVYPLTDDIRRLEKLKNLYIGDKKIKVTVEKIWYQKNLVILKFKEYDNINEVEVYKNEYLYIDEKDKIVLPDDTYFIFDIIGCKVIDISNNEIGIVSEVLTNMSNDIYVVKDLNSHKEYLIPAVKQFIKEISIEEKKIVIEPIEGLIEWK